MTTVRRHTENLFFQAIADLFEWGAVGLLALLNLLLLSQSAGYGPEPLIPATALCGAMVVCHGLWQALSRAPFSLQVHPFAPWLLLLWGVFMVYALASPAGWQAQYEATVITIGLVAFWVGAHHLRQPAHIYTLLIAIAAPVAVGVVYALLQTLAQLEGRMWVLNLLDKALQQADGGIAPGIASGLFGSSAPFAGLLAIVLSLAVVYALCVRWGKAVRICLFVFCWFILWVLVMTQDVRALLVGVLMLFAAPFVARSRDLPVKLALPLLVALFLSALLVACLSSASTWEWIGNGLTAEAERNLLAGGWAMFADRPLLGAGLGNFANAFEAYRQVGLTAAQTGDLPLGIKLPGETGLVGTLAALGLGCWLFIRFVRGWLPLPNAVRVEAEDIVLAGRRYCQPLGTVTAGAVLLAVSAAALLLLLGNPLGEASLLVLVASLFGLGAAQLPLRWRQLKPHRRSGLLLTFGSLAIAIAFPVLSLPVLASRLYAKQAETALARWEQLSLLELRQERGAISRQQRRLEKALRLLPGNAPAWVQLSHLEILRLYDEGESTRRIGDKAREAAFTALREHGGYLPAWLAMAEAEQALGNVEQAESALQAAIGCAPHNADCWYRLAVLLKQRPASREGALHAINESLKLDPHNPAAQQVYQQLMIP